jgi:tyrosyl-tRNA synthetase
MDFIAELRWRGMLHNITPDVETYLAQTPKATAYIGFDPTAPSLTIGNYVQMMLLTLWQRAGHQPIVLMGGATGRIGDPSGKDAERQLKSFDELDSNLDFQTRQMRKILDFENGNNRAILVNNYDFYKNMNALDFLRDVGKTMTVAYMLSKESVQRRLETGISFTEFSYQLLQGYDFQCLFQQHNCHIQMGGSDQWGNITAGTEFIRRNLSQHAYAITTPLLTKADGTKFGKSEGGNIWLDAKLTSPYKFYQFWINCSDADLPKFTRYFTLHSQQTIEQREAELADNPRELKRLLAEELTVRIHGDAAYQRVLRVSDILFNAKATREQLLSLEVEAFKTVAEEIPAFIIGTPLFTDQGVNVPELLAEHTQVLSSKGEVRRAIANNAISINKEKISNPDTFISSSALIHGKFLMVENGKKNKFILVVQ